MCLIKELVRSADIAKSFQSPFEKMTDGYLFNNISLGDRGGADLSALVKEMQNGGSKDVLGIVATLGKVDDDNLSRLLSEYLGVETMLGIVCKTYEGVKAVETYDKEGHINSDSGIQGFGTTIGWTLDRRFLVICLENLRPYCGEFVDDDPQRRLDLLKPRLPNGECPPGFIGFAVNMIHVDYMNLLYVSDVHGLRETLFYSLFSRLQVYKSREEMLLALPLISDGAISLDGGMIKPDGFFSMGNRTDVDVRFPKPSMSANPPDSCQRTDTLPTESPTPNRPRRARAAPVWHQDFIME